MKLIVTIMVILLPVAAVGQNPNMQGMDMQKMMQAMQEMQQCMEKVDKTELRKMEEESDEMSRELQALCEQGKRDKAQKKAISYGKKIMKNPALEQMRKCGELTKGLIPSDSREPTLDEEFDFSNRHVCDK